MRFTLLIVLCFLAASSHAQFLLSCHTEYDDTFREWEFQVEIDSSITEEGSLEIIWGLNNDFSEWQYSFGDVNGEIVQKFPNNQALWELRSDGKRISISQVWPGDDTEWKISDGKVTLRMLASRNDGYNYWYNKNQSQGDLRIYTESFNDNRDWIVEDYMNESIPFEHRMAATFICIFTSSPKI